MKNKDAPAAPLHPLDSEKQTYGCRHTNPDICSRNGIKAVCALVRGNKSCTSPPQRWPSQFKKLQLNGTVMTGPGPAGKGKS